MRICVSLIAALVAVASFTEAVDSCKRQPFRGRCPSINGETPKRSQFVLRYYLRNGECVSYPYGHCASDPSEPQLYRYKEECEDACISNAPANLGAPKTSTTQDYQKELLTEEVKRVEFYTSTTPYTPQSPTTITSTQASPPASPPAHPSPPAPEFRRKQNQNLNRTPESRAPESLDQDQQPFEFNENDLFASENMGKPPVEESTTTMVSTSTTTTTEEPVTSTTPSTTTSTSTTTTSTTTEAPTTSTTSTTTERPTTSTTTEEPTTTTIRMTSSTTPSTTTRVVTTTPSTTTTTRTTTEQPTTTTRTTTRQVTTTTTEEVRTTEASTTTSRPTSAVTEESRTTTAAPRTECLRRRAFASSSTIKGAFVPVCTNTGEFEKVQCETDLSQCFCVNSHGIELPNSRTKEFRPDCNSIQSSRIVNVKECVGSAAPGPCHGKFDRYFYNEDTQKCEEFVYSGCGGNGNNYDSKEACEGRCAPPPFGIPKCELGEPLKTKIGVPVNCNKTDCPSGYKCSVVQHSSVCCPENKRILGLQTNGRASKCALPKERGPCDKYELRFYFNADLNECKYFFWGGCEGNQNNFARVEDCEASCGVQKSGVTNRPNTEIRTTQGIRITPNGRMNWKDEEEGDAETTTPLAPSTTTAGATRTVPTTTTRTATTERPTTTTPVTTRAGRVSTTPIATTTASEDSEEEEVEEEEGEEKDNTESIHVQPPVPVQNTVLLGGIDDSTTDSVNRCLHPRDAGNCRGQFVRWFFDAERKVCDVFTYTGCQGNGNNFASREECMAICHKPEPVPSATPDFNQICSNDVDAGECNGVFERFAFDSEAGNCRAFTYGGCGGNGNNFATMQECKQRCVKSADAPVNACDSEIDFGECSGVFHRFAFDKSINNCKQFTYGGCGGNGNNFATLQECTNKCINRVCPETPACDLQRCQLVNDRSGCPFCSCPPVKQPMPPAPQCTPINKAKCEEPCIIFSNRKGCEECVCPQAGSGTGSGSVSPPAPQTSSALPPSPSRVNPGPPGTGGFRPTEAAPPASPASHPPRQFAVNTVEQPVKPSELPHLPREFASQLEEKCLQPVEPGPCKNFADRWYFNVEDGTCHPFKYGGCAGNRNHFFTQKECEVHCARFLSGSTSSKLQVVQHSRPSAPHVNLQPEHDTEHETESQPQPREELELIGAPVDTTSTTTINTQDLLNSNFAGALDAFPAPRLVHRPRQHSASNVEVDKPIEYSAGTSYNSPKIESYAPPTPNNNLVGLSPPVHPTYFTYNGQDQGQRRQFAVNQASFENRQPVPIPPQVPFQQFQQIPNEIFVARPVAGPTHNLVPIHIAAPTHPPATIPTTADMNLRSNVGSQEFENAQQHRASVLPPSPSTSAPQRSLPRENNENFGTGRSSQPREHPQEHPPEREPEPEDERIPANPVQGRGRYQGKQRNQVNTETIDSIEDEVEPVRRFEIDEGVNRQRPVEVVQPRAFAPSRPHVVPNVEQGRPIPTNAPETPAAPQVPAQNRFSIAASTQNARPTQRAVSPQTTSTATTITTTTTKKASPSPWYQSTTAPWWLQNPTSQTTTEEPRKRAHLKIEKIDKNQQKTSRTEESVFESSSSNNDPSQPARFNFDRSRYVFYNGDYYGPTIPGVRVRNGYVPKDGNEQERREAQAAFEQFKELSTGFQEEAKKYLNNQKTKTGIEERGNFVIGAYRGKLADGGKGGLNNDDSDSEEEDEVSSETHGLRKPVAHGVPIQPIVPLVVPTYNAPTPASRGLAAPPGHQDAAGKNFAAPVLEGLDTFTSSDSHPPAPSTTIVPRLSNLNLGNVISQGARIQGFVVNTKSTTLSPPSTTTTTLKSTTTTPVTTTTKSSPTEAPEVEEVPEAPETRRTPQRIINEAQLSEEEIEEENVRQSVIKEVQEEKAGSVQVVDLEKFNTAPRAQEVAEDFDKQMFGSGAGSGSEFEEESHEEVKEHHQNQKPVNLATPVVEPEEPETTTPITTTTVSPPVQETTTTTLKKVEIRPRVSVTDTDTDTDSVTTPETSTPTQTPQTESVPSATTGVVVEQTETETETETEAPTTQPSTTTASPSSTTPVATTATEATVPSSSTTEATEATEAITKTTTEVTTEVTTEAATEATTSESASASASVTPQLITSSESGETPSDFAFNSDEQDVNTEIVETTEHRASGSKTLEAVKAVETHKFLKENEGSDNGISRKLETISFESNESEKAAVIVPTIPIPAPAPTVARTQAQPQTVRPTVAVTPVPTTQQPQFEPKFDGRVVCALPPDAGTCASYIPRWFFNSQTGQCEQFAYGSCGGNENNFIDRSTCERKCMPHHVILAQVPERCSFDKNSGNGRGYNVKWYFNMKNLRCEQFVYEGLGGNANQFDTLSECERICTPANSKASPSTPINTASLPPRPTVQPTNPPTLDSDSEEEYDDEDGIIIPESNDLPPLPNVGPAVLGNVDENVELRLPPLVGSPRRVDTQTPPANVFSPTSTQQPQPQPQQPRQPQQPQQPQQVFPVQPVQPVATNPTTAGTAATAPPTAPTAPTAPTTTTTVAPPPAPTPAVTVPNVAAPTHQPSSPIVPAVQPAQIPVVQPFQPVHQFQGEEVIQPSQPITEDGGPQGPIIPRILSVPELPGLVDVTLATLPPSAEPRPPAAHAAKTITAEEVEKKTYKAEPVLGRETLPTANDGQPIVGASPVETVNYQTGEVRSKVSGIKSFPAVGDGKLNAEIFNTKSANGMPACANGRQEVRYSDGRPVMCLPGKNQCPDKSSCYFNGIDFFCCPDEEDPYDKHVFGGYNGEETKNGYKVFGGLKIRRLMDEVPLRQKRQAVDFNIDSIVAPLRFDAEKPRTVSRALHMKQNPTPRHGANHLCIQQVVRGSCQEAHLRYYYDRQSDSCRLFEYSGCDGNANNFGSLEDCQRLCVLDVKNIKNGQVATTTVAPITDEEDRKLAPGQCPGGHPPLGGSSPVLCGNSTESIGCPSSYYCRRGPPDVCCPGVDPKMQQPEEMVKEPIRGVVKNESHMPRGFNRQIFLSTPKYMCPDAADPLLLENGEAMLCGSGFDGVKMCPRGYYCAIDSARNSRLCCPLYGDSHRIASEEIFAHKLSYTEPSTTTRAPEVVEEDAEEEEEEEEGEDFLAHLQMKPNKPKDQVEELAKSSPVATDLNTESAVSIDLGADEKVAVEEEVTTTTEKMMVQDKSTCQIKPSEGRICNENETPTRTNLQYFYSPRDNRCKLFFFRGCGGNLNRFEKKADCEALCL